MHLTREQVQDIVGVYKSDPKLFFEKCLKIAPKDKHVTGLIPLKLSPIQLKTHEIAEHVRELCGVERYINCKARQVYLTTYWTARAFYYHYFSEGPRQTDLMGDVSKTTESMIEMWDRYYENLPHYLQRALRGQRGSKRAGARRATPTHHFVDSGANIKKHTALSRNRRSGQGTTGSSFIATETPYYDYAEQVLLAMLNALAQRPGTLGVLEGTANGAQGLFYQMWLDAIDHSEQLCRRYGARDLDDLLWNRTGWGDKVGPDGVTHPKGYWDGSWLPIFWPWFANPEYVDDPRKEDVNEDTLDDVERALISDHGVSFGQLAWRRMAIRDKCGKDVRRFQQEYPSTWREAFLMSGSPVFPMEIIDRELRRTEQLRTRMARTPQGREVPVIQQCDMRWSRDDYPRHEPRYDEYGNCSNRDTLRAEAVPGLGDFLLRRLPRGGYHGRYVIGADVAKGLEQGDYSVAYVYDLVDRQWVMMYRGHCTEKRFAEILAMMGRYYRNAAILVESNVGQAVLDPLQVLYTNVLYEKKDKPGFYTSEQSKLVLVGELQTWIENEAHTMPFYQFFDEARTFTRDERGHMSAEGKRRDPGVKNFDDAVMAAGLTLMAARMAPPPRPIHPKEMDDVERQMRRTTKRRTIEDYEGVMR